MQSLGEIGRSNYADDFMFRVIKTEKEKWGITDTHMMEIVY